MKIFFTGAIRGGRARQPNYAAIVKILRQYGTVLSEHVADETISEYGETDVSKEKIHDRELEALAKSDAVVAEVTTPSLGVGYLIAHASRLEKKIIALYNGEDTLKLSAMIKGDAHVTVYAYETLDDLQKTLNSAFGQKI